MSFKVIIGKRAEKGIRRLTPVNLKRFAELVETLKINHIPHPARIMIVTS